MKKAMVTILSVLFFLASKAQVAEFLSLKSTTSQKDSAGDFVQTKIWLVQEMRIKFDLTKQRLQFFSKGLLDRDPLTLMKEIFIVTGTTSPNSDSENVMKDFSGIDKAGRKCAVRLNLTKDEYKIQDGELRVVYRDHEEIYKVRAIRQNPSFN